MKVISHRKLVEFYQKHPDSKTALEAWYLQVKCSKWSGYNDLKSCFNSVDAIGNQRYVFNVKGNHYRVVVVIQFTHGYVYVRFVGTHEEYNKINCLTI